MTKSLEETPPSTLRQKERRELNYAAAHFSVTASGKHTSLMECQWKVNCISRSRVQTGSLCYTQLAGSGPNPVIQQCGACWDIKQMPLMAKQWIQQPEMITSTLCLTAGWTRWAAPDLCDGDVSFSQHGLIQLLVSAKKTRGHAKGEMDRGGQLENRNPLLKMTHLKATDSRIARTRWFLVVEGLRPMSEAQALGSFRGAFG